MTPLERMMPRAWWLVLVLAGCGGGLERAAFVSDLLSYPREGRVGLTLTNVSTQELGVNLCLSQLITADGKTYGPSEAASCTSLEPAPLPVGKAIEVRKTIPVDLAPGSWRYATTIRLPSGASELVYTQVFTVQ